MSLEIGQLIEGKYRIVRLIGEGGMGAVYEGENVRINRRVAIKVLHAAFTGNAEVMQRFDREAQAARVQQQLADLKRKLGRQD